MSNWSRSLNGVQTFSEVSASVSISGGTLTLDLGTADIFYVNLNADISNITVSNTQTIGASAFTLIFTADGTPRIITWPINFLWPGGFSPTLTSTTGKEDIFSFVTMDAGTTWYSFVGGQNL